MIFLEETTTHEIVIQKSRFITVLTPIESLDEVAPLLVAIKKAYPKATHYCTAYILGNLGEYQGSNDDGEPSGTAGVPMLEILRHRNLTNVYAVVIRYFGGVKLGAGGLIRAYAGAVKDTLDTFANFYQKIKAPVYQVRFSYHLIALIDQSFKDDIILDKIFETDVIYRICFPKNNIDTLETIKHLCLDIKQEDDKVLHLPWP